MIKEEGKVRSSSRRTSTTARRFVCASRFSASARSFSRTSASRRATA